MHEDVWSDKAEEEENKYGGEGTQHLFSREFATHHSFLSIEDDVVEAADETHKARHVFYTHLTKSITSILSSYVKYISSSNFAKDCQGVTVFTDFFWLHFLV